MSARCASSSRRSTRFESPSRSSRWAQPTTHQSSGECVKYIMLWSNELAVSFLRSIYLSFLASCSWERMHIWCLLVKVVGVFFLFFFFSFFFFRHIHRPRLSCVQSVQSPSPSSACFPRLLSFITRPSALFSHRLTTWKSFWRKSMSCFFSKGRTTLKFSGGNPSPALTCRFSSLTSTSLRWTRPR